MIKRVLCLLALAYILASVPPAITTAASFSTSASATPASAPRGTAVAIDAVVHSDTTMNALVDLEIYAPDGQRVFQQFWDNQALNAGQSKTLRGSWTPSANAVLGRYSIRIGLFSPGWGTLYHWNNSAGQLSLVASPAGSGLTGSYYDNRDFTALKLTRTDPTINFSWGSGSPAASIGVDTFSVRWQGQVQPNFSETYTFYTTSDDGVRLWVNGQQIINNWTYHAPTENRGTISLSAGQRYDIRLEYFEGGSGATIRLSWSSPSQPKQIIPQSQLYPAASAQPTATPTTPSATPKPTTATPTTPTPGSGRYFSTLPPGSALPNDAECAAAIKRRPENKRMNVGPNTTPGNQRLASNFFGGSDPRANSQFATRVTGNFTGTTDEILQWAACKWGVDEDMVRAQAAVESWWRQNTKGDWTTDATRCAPGHGLGADGRSGECPESFGILQNRYPYEQSAWPGIHDSTAFNADTTYAIWRACYEGYEWWLNDVEHGQPYAAGDALGCMGRWFAGRWHTQAANDYSGRVQGYLNDRIWEKPEFQEP